MPDRQDQDTPQFGPWVDGLVNAVDEHSIPPTGLSIAENILIDRDGVITTRNKWELLDAAHYVSAFKHNGVTYAVRGDSPRQIGIVGEGSFSALDTVVGPVSWTVLLDKPVYTDGEVIRIIRDEQALPLDAGYFKDDEEDEYQLVPIPGGSHIHYWQGRFLIARGTSLLWSEAMRYGIYSATRNFVRFPSKISWVAPLPTGVYVGIRENVYFLSGSDPAKFTMRVVSGESAPGAALVYKARHVDAAGEEVALWFTSDGIAIGTQAGTVEYPQKGRLKDLPLRHGKMVADGDRVTVFTTKEH
jgi:hypothetical protein